MYPQEEAEHLNPLFDKYIESTLSFKNSNCRELIPITELNGVISLCRLYDSLATPENGVRLSSPKTGLISTSPSPLIDLLLVVLTVTVAVITA